MYEIVYIGDSKKNKEFFLTNQEFQEALNFWNDKKNYFCQRLKALLTPNFKWAELPKEDMWADEVFIAIEKEKEKDYVTKVFKKNDNFFILVKKENGREMSQVEKSYFGSEKNLIKQEEYYTEKLYLN